MKLSLSEALTHIASSIAPLSTVETVPLMKAFGRICAQPLIARMCVPPHSISLRDGWVVPFDALPLHHFEGLLPISTGGRVPDNAACILENEALAHANPRLITPDKSFIKAKGEDIKAGECLVQKGEKIGPFDITNLASQGFHTLQVIKEARIAYVGIGDELMDVKEEQKEGFIYNSNAYTMAARGEMMGGRTATITHTSDTPEAIFSTLKGLCHADAIITSGGMSTHDAMHSLLENGTLSPLFKGVAIAPAGLTALSFLGKTPIVHLPGLPMSSLLGFEVIGAALIRKLYGMAEAQSCIQTTTQEAIKAHPFSQSIVPGFFDGKAFWPKQIAAGMINVLNHCNGFVLTQCNQPLLEGEAVTFCPFLAWN